MKLGHIATAKPTKMHEHRKGSGEGRGHTTTNQINKNE